VGRNRKKNRHLPPRVYQRRGKLYYVMPGTEDWIPLPDGLKTWAAIVESADATETMSALWAKYELEELGKKAKKTQTNRRQEWKMLEPVFGAMKPRDVESHHAWNYWKKRGEIEQAKKEIRCLSAVLTFGKRTGAFSHQNPCFGLQLPDSPPRQHYVTDDAFLYVRERAQTMVGYAMDISYITGIDEGTILQLERKNLTDEGIKFFRSKTKGRATSKEQIIEWSDELKVIISSLLKEKPQVRRALICNRKGQPYAPSGFQSQWQRLMRRCKKEGFTDHFHFHDIRAKSASEADTDQEAADRLGHADVRLTQRVYRRLPKRAQALRILDTNRIIGRAKEVKERK
jgi:integrase